MNKKPIKTLSEKYMTDVDLASRYFLSPKTLANWRSLGFGPEFKKIGRKVFYPIAAIKKWERANKSEQAND